MSFAPLPPFPVFPSSFPSFSLAPAPGAWCLVGGSRSLPASAAPLVASVVRGLLGAGCRLSLGCCVGADALALSAALAAGAAPRVRVSAFFGPAGAGALPGLSSVSGVCAAAAAGVAVSWFAGGLAPVPVRARLLRRSLAALAGCALAVFFSPGAGSLAVAARALRAGVPVWAVCPVAPAPVPGCPGSWVPVGAFVGAGSAAVWFWSPPAPAPAAPSQPSLF